MSVYLQMVGRVYGRLLVEEVHLAGSLTQVTCLCTCGVRKIVYAGNLRAGHTQSCGCLHKERTSAAQTTHGHTPVGTDGRQRMSKEYRAWSHMLQRCTNPNDDKYPQYGGRGIDVCDRWYSFENFFADMGTAPGATYSLDRRRVNEGYSLDNCRWATATQQANNRQDTVRVKYHGRSRTLSALSRIAGIATEVLRSRLKGGWSVDRAMSTPLRRRQA